MTLASFAFYMFATVTVASALMVISARNPVHSVLFLIMTFFNSAGIFLLLGIANSKLLSPLNKTWVKFGEILGRIIAPLIMALVYFLILKNYPIFKFQN